MRAGRFKRRKLKQVELQIHEAKADADEVARGALIEVVERVHRQVTESTSRPTLVSLRVIRMEEKELVGVGPKEEDEGEEVVEDVDSKQSWTRQLLQ